MDILAGAMQAACLWISAGLIWNLRAVGPPAARTGERKGECDQKQRGQLGGRHGLARDDFHGRPDQAPEKAEQGEQHHSLQGTCLPRVWQRLHPNRSSSDRQDFADLAYGCYIGEIGDIRA